jgi:hypothetical protein
MTNSFFIRTHTKHHRDSEIKNGEFGRTCDNGREEKFIKDFF